MAGGHAGSFEAFLRRLEELFAGVEELEEPVRSEVIELLDGIDTLHRSALEHLAEALDPETLARLREAHPAVAWLFDAYQIGSRSAPPVSVEIRPPRRR